MATHSLAITVPNYNVVLLVVSDAIQCYHCESSPRDGKFCRRTAEARLMDCDSTFCSALVWMENGKRSSYPLSS